MVSSNTCRHENIAWDDLFKENKSTRNKFYCLDCGEVKGALFAMAITKWYKQKIEDWLKDNKLVEKFENDGRKGYFFHDWIKFLEKNNYKEVWDKFCRGKIDESYFDGFGEQMVIFEFAKSIESFCLEFKKEKQNNPNAPQPRKRKRKGKDNNQPTEREREREREREQIRSEISNLENKPNRTTEEEQELANKKDKLAKLVNNPQSPPFNYTPYLIGGAVIILVGLIAYYFTKKNNKNQHAI